MLSYLHFHYNTSDHFLQILLVYCPLADNLGRILAITYKLLRQIRLAATVNIYRVMY